MLWCWLSPLSLAFLYLLSLQGIVEAWTQQGTKLVGNDFAGEYSFQGRSVSMSADGTTLAVGGYGDDSNLGATWIFTRSLNGTWIQQGPKLVGNDSVGTTVYQGHSVSLSADGNTLAFGGYADNNYFGATWVFTRTGSTWSQQGTKLVGTGAIGTSVYQGWWVSLSGNGDTLAIGGYSDNNTFGATWIFVRNNNSTWIQQGPKLVGTGNVGTVIRQGFAVALSKDGNTLAVGGTGDNSSLGATWIFVRNNDTVWTQQGTKLVGTGFSGDAVDQGSALSLSGNGNTLAVGGLSDNSNTGATWIFTRSGSTWSQQGSKLVGTGGVGSTIIQGTAVALSYDGSVLAVGGKGDHSSTGATWIFARTGSTWTQQGTKLLGIGASDTTARQGYAVSLSFDGNILAVGAIGDASNRGATFVFKDCDPGYRWNGSVCTDCNECLGECVTSNASCPPNAQCTNLPGSFNCGCNPGYHDNGINNCTDCDECSGECGGFCFPNGICVNTPGSFDCSCLPGFVPNVTVCTQCQNNTYQSLDFCEPCPPGATSPPGSFTLASCVCSKGTQLNLTLGVCEGLSCPAENLNGTIWPRTFPGVFARGTCVTGYAMFEGSVPSYSVIPQRRCLLSADESEANWESSFISCEPTCALQPCQYGGSCTYNTCHCQAQTRGKYCEVLGEAPKCGTDVICKNGGVCVPGATPGDPATCDCTGTLFVGSRCQAESITCQPNPCLNYAQCSRTGVNEISCACRGTGYHGQFCQVAMEGDCRVQDQKCPETVSQCIMDVATDSAVCVCQSRYIGETCELDLVYLVAVPLVMLLVFGIYFFLNNRFRKARNSVVLTISLALYDFVTDALFVFSLSPSGENAGDNHDLFVASLVFVVIPVLANLCVLVWIFMVSLRNAAGMREWLEKHPSTTAATAVLGLTNVESLSLLNSNFFHYEGFNAPFDEKTRHLLRMSGLMGSVLEDIPQLIIQAMVASKSLNTITLLSVVASVLTITSNLFKHAILFCAGRVKSPLDPNQQDPDDDAGDNAYHLLEDSHQ